MKRCSGVLLHLTSLPGRYGIGDLGAPAYRFVDFLESCGQSVWQILPWGPTGFGDSPYQSFSAFAGNPLLISPDTLLEEGILLDSDLALLPSFSDREIDFGRLTPWKMSLLRRAARRFQSRAGGAQEEAFGEYCRENRYWLDDYALFMALKRVHEGREWALWEAPLAAREPAALADWENRLQEETYYHRFLQFQFFRQWESLRKYARSKNIFFFGDLPIFVSADSADVWSRQDLFCLDAQGRPTAVSGVPPDYFSETGQLWGNPIYRWEVMRQDGYDWWIRRFRQAFQIADFIRVDHFRGFEAYWEIPAGELTAVRGRWVKCPGEELFQRVRQVLGRLPIVAENLGLITPEVEALRERFGFPGMTVLQFAFGGADAQNCHLPHHYRRNSVAYTGTHDNDTTRGWWEQLQSEALQPAFPAAAREREFVMRYLAPGQEEFPWAAMRAVARSSAAWAIFPLQDVLGLGSEARMNRPSAPMGNWRWRLAAEQLTPQVIDRFRDLTFLYSRESGPPRHESGEVKGDRI